MLAIFFFFFHLQNPPLIQTRLKIHSIKNIVSLENVDKDHGGGHSSGFADLLGSHSNVEDHPSNQTGPELTEDLFCLFVVVKESCFM